MFFNIKNIISKKLLLRFVGLFTVNILGLPLGAITSIVITRYLGAQEYGDYKFLDSVFKMAIVICNFGLYNATSRALLLNKDRTHARQYYATSLLITLGLGLIMGIGLFIYATFDPNIESKGLYNVFLCLIPFAAVYIINHCFEIILQADNQIKLLSIVRLLPKIGYLVGGVVALMFLQNVTFSKLLIVCYIYFSTQIIVYLYVFTKLSPQFCDIKLRWAEIKRYNREYGFDVYIGALFAVGFSTLPDILISYFGVDNQGVGFYSLSLMLASPLAFIPSTVSTIQYREYAYRTSIPTKSIVITLALSLCAMIALWLIIPIFIDYFYTPEFAVVSEYSRVIGLGVLLYGMADFVNRFIGAQGRGRLLRNSSFAVGISVLVFNLALIPHFGAWGAVWSKLIVGTIYLSLMIYCYLKVTKELKQSL